MQTDTAADFLGPENAEALGELCTGLDVEAPIFPSICAHSAIIHLSGKFSHTTFRFMPMSTDVLFE